MKGGWQELQGYRRSDGRYGIRNRVVVLAAADNVNPVVRRLGEIHPNVVAIPATFGRGQLGADLELMVRTMAGIAAHPNVSGALVVSFEPESSVRIAEAARQLGREVEWVSLLREGGLTPTVQRASSIIERLLVVAARESPEPMPPETLLVGLECGGSDATSGLVANPAIGWFTDDFLAQGGSAVFSEPVELAGCEEILDRRAATPEVARAIRRLIKRYERIASDAGIDLTGTNPTPDNIAGGLSTIEEKSLGAIVKTGSASIQGVVEYAERPTGQGLWLMDAPAAAVENITALVAGGCQLILFATGSGNPSGSPVTPTVKICANPETCRRMAEHIDVDISAGLTGSMTIAEAGVQVRSAVLDVLAGRDTCADSLGYVETRVSRIGPSV